MSLEHSPARQKKAAFSKTRLRKNEPIPESVDQTLTINGFCQAEHVSRNKLYELWKQGIGPDFYWLGCERRITQDARKRWQAEREAAARAQAAGERS
jgi:hypothetical protein